ncbi:MFS transporter, DHA2 family, metal-tetracycline-proton antiporter [Enterococcus sp. DIV0212c]|uniref:MFS transporter n=1 Tax=Enterococcus sp. DIV0212c TaxID=2230867 RepID=UPI001A9ABA60|nr:MFS transporter [Enterococcus sp. DIV0212c]MBO1354686.1 MFS transporter [Enterococcus sp. DIV0212c]
MEKNVKKVMPMIMFVFILAGTLQEAINICAPVIAKDLAIPSSSVSMISAVAMLTMGVSYIVYTSLSDFVSIKKLLIIGITISTIGSIGGLLFSHSFILLIIFRAIQMAGGTSASALLILTATRYLSEETRIKYYGYNTACFSGGQMLGILLGGLFATYVGWKFLFAVPIFSLLAIPLILKYLPDDSKDGTKKIDFFGITLMSALSLFISLYFNMLKPSLLLISIAIAISFLVYISKYKHAFITIDFFKNWKYMLVILVVLLTYLPQGSYSFLFSFMAANVYHIPLSKISMLLLPSYLVSMIIGIMGGRITKKMGVTRTLLMGMGSMALGVLIGSIFLEKSISVLFLMSCLFNGGFAILYTPIMILVINSLPENMRGTGLGFFNLCIKIASSTGLVITGKLITNNSLQHTQMLKHISESSLVYSNILLIFFAVVIVSLITANVVKRFLLK